MSSSREKQDDTGDLLLSGTVHVLLATGTYKQLDYSILVDKNLSKDPIFAIYMYNVYKNHSKIRYHPLKMVKSLSVSSFQTIQHTGTCIHDPAAM